MLKPHYKEIMAVRITEKNLQELRNFCAANNTFDAAPDNPIGEWFVFINGEYDILLGEVKLLPTNDKPSCFGKYYHGSCCDICHEEGVCMHEVVGNEMGEYNRTHTNKDGKPLCFGCYSVSDCSKYRCKAKKACFRELARRKADYWDALSK